MSKATIYITDLTQVDFCYYDASSNSFIGSSFSVDIVLTGNLSSEEAVVADFSTVKKAIKELIDGPTGLDHKLWVKQKDFSSEGFLCDEKDHRVFESKVEGNNTGFVLPVTAFHTIPDDLEFTLESFGVYLTKYLKQELQTLFSEYETTDISVSCNDKPTIHRIPGYKSMVCTFRYVHGLRASTSKACQNILHGHKSFLTYYRREDHTGLSEHPHLAKAASLLDRVMFCNSSQISGNSLSYNTERGHFNVVWEDTQRIIALPVDTTIENIAAHLSFLIDFSALVELGVDYIGISEGLKKGALIKVSDYTDTKCWTK